MSLGAPSHDGQVDRISGERIEMLPWHSIHVGDTVIIGDKRYLAYSKAKGDEKDDIFLQEIVGPGVKPERFVAPDPTEEFQVIRAPQRPKK